MKKMRTIKKQYNQMEQQKDQLKTKFSKIIILMEYQSVKGENPLNINQNAAYDIKIKYHNFYNNVDLEESDQLGSDLDYLDDVLNQDKGCNLSSENEYSNCIKRNPRVAEIPTVYLVTCIKTQYLPKKSYWDIYASQSETNQSPEKSTYQNRQNLDFKPRKYMRKEIIKGQGYIREFNERSFSSKKQQFNRNLVLKPIEKNLRNQHDRQWKTEYITIRCHQLQKNQTQKRKLMHKQIQTSKIQDKKKKKKTYNEFSRSKLYIKRILSILDDKQNLNKKKLCQNQLNLDEKLSDAQQKSWRDFFVREHMSENNRSQDLKYVIVEDEKPISINQNRKKTYSHYQSVNSYRNMNHQDTNRIRNVILVESCIRMKQNLQIRSLGQSSSDKSSKKRMRVKFESYGEPEFERQERLSRKKSKQDELLGQKFLSKYVCGKSYGAVDRHS